MSNPNPARITAALWRLWTDRPVKAWKLGGIYANKPGYHSSRAENQARWPGNYSIRVPADLRGPADKAAAIDYTMTDAEIRKRSAYLLDGCNRGDPRLEAVREWYGTVNGRVVVGRIHDSPAGPWRASSADSSHLWHIHISFFRQFADEWAALAPVLSVLAGQTWEQWQAEQRGGLIMLPREGDEGDHVEVIQRMLVGLGYDTAPGKTNTERYDGVYGPATSAAVNAFRAEHNLDPVKRVTPWTYYALVRDTGAAQAVKAVDAMVKNAARSAQEAAVAAAEEAVGRAVTGTVEQAAVAWLEANRASLAGRDGRDGVDGKTPKRIRLELVGDVIDVAD